MKIQDDERRAANGAVIEKYNEIPSIAGQEYYMNIPGVYCQNCGDVSALYSFSGFQPDNIDENGKPYYDKCLICAPERLEQLAVTLCSKIP